MENDQCSLIQDGALFKTRQDALSSTKAGFRGIADISYQFDQQHIKLLSPTIALATGVGTTSLTLSDDRNIESRFAQSVVLLLRDNEWMVYHAHRSLPNH
jgi:hypothetical protein